MVVYVEMEKDQNTTLNPSLINVSCKKTHCAECKCGVNSNRDSHLNPGLLRGKTLQAKVCINTGQNIGFQVNTRLHVKQKKRSSFNLVKFTLYCLLLSYLIWTTLELHGLRNELYVTKLQLDSLTDSFDFLSRSIRKMEQEDFKMENLAKDKVFPEREHLLNKRAAEFPTTCLDCTNSTRQARSIFRGKHSHSKKRNSCRRRCYRTSGPFAIHLKGALPEITVRDGGIIAPWHIDQISSGVFLLEDGIIGEGRGIVEIVEEGLYFIYAQMYYLTSDTLNSYAINLQLGEEGERGMENDLVVAVCSAEAASHKLSELSCYTAVVRYLRRGDRIYLTQRERNRKIIFRDNRSFLGLTLLNSLQGFP